MSAPWRVIDRALNDASAAAQTDQELRRIAEARVALSSYVEAPAHAATVTTTMAAVRDARRIWGTEGWVLDEIESALVGGRMPDLAGARDRLRKSDVPGSRS